MYVRRWFLVFAAALLLQLGAQLHAHAAQTDQTSRPLAEYQQLLQSAATALQQEPTSATVQRIQAQLRAIEQVTVENERAIVVRPFLGTNADDLPTVAVAQARLSLVIANLEAVPEDTLATQLALLETILARPAFVARDSLWDRFWRWLRSFLPDSAPSGDGAAPFVSGGITLLGWLVIGAAALLLIYLLSFWLQNLLGLIARGDETAGKRGLHDEPRNAAEARAQAHQLAAGGSFREAVRRMYLSALLTLDEQRVLYYDRSSTNREVLASLQPNQSLYQKLQPVVEIFDEVWYGVHEPDRNTFERYVQAVEALPTASSMPAEPNSTATGPKRAERIP